jgi:transcription factor SOX7/8/10/18 (SOX group E/F)
MWKEVPADVKLQYKQQAAAAQGEFKRAHPDYTYRKARRKRALNELLTKTTQGFAPGNFSGDPAMLNPLFNPANPYFMQMYGQAAQQATLPPGQMPPLGMPNMGVPMMGAPGAPQGYPNLQGFPGLGDPNQNSLYQFPPK